MNGQLTSCDRAQEREEEAEESASNVVDDTGDFGSDGSWVGGELAGSNWDGTGLDGIGGILERSSNLNKRFLDSGNGGCNIGRLGEWPNLRDVGLYREALEWLQAVYVSV